MIDIEATLRAHLLTVPDLAAKVGARIYCGPDLPPGYTLADGAAILLAARGGPQHYSSGLFTASVQFRCYASGSVAVRELDGALYDALNDEQFGVVRMARLDDYPQLLTEPETDWMFSLSFYTVTIGS